MITEKIKFFLVTIKFLIQLVFYFHGDNSYIHLNLIISQMISIYFVTSNCFSMSGSSVFLYLHSQKNEDQTEPPHGVIRYINKDQVAVLFDCSDIAHEYFDENETYYFIYNHCNKYRSLEEGIKAVEYSSNQVSRVIFDGLPPSLPVQLDSPVQFFNGKYRSYIVTCFS